MAESQIFLDNVEMVGIADSKRMKMETQLCLPPLVSLQEKRIPCADVETVGWEDSVFLRTQAGIMG